MTVDDEDEGLEVGRAAVSASRVAVVRWQWLLLSSMPIFSLSLPNFGLWREKKFVAVVVGEGERERERENPRKRGRGVG